jgi:hypothetical protein
MHATASARNADLVGADAMAMDRHRAFSERTGHSPAASEDTRLRAYARSGRAGDTYAIRVVRLRLLTSAQPGVHAADSTARSDRDGTTTRPAAITFMHATASARNADLTGADTMARDRHRARSLRIGHDATDSQDTRVRTYAFSSRAGDSYAVRQLLLRLTEGSRPTIYAADTTNRTDKDGATLRVPTWGVHHAPSSPLNSALAAGGTYRDRFRTERLRLDEDNVGHVHRLQFRTDGRAGSTSVPQVILVEYSPTELHVHKAAET